MKNTRFTVILHLTLLVAISSVWAQETPLNPANNSVSKYDYHDAFAPFFYTKNGTNTRSASGQPGAEYWQNRADYQLTAKLNEKSNEISGTGIITYTNNSPDKMNFVWMNLDQNLFKSDSRGNALVRQPSVLLRQILLDLFRKGFFLLAKLPLVFQNQFLIRKPVLLFDLWLVFGCHFQTY
jgi:hypothetical protein